MATAGYLISRAAERPAILSLTVAIVAVRFFGLARPIARYLERLASHDLAFRVLARVRVRVYERIEPLAPVELDGYRRGDLLSRMVADVDALQNLHLRGVAPPLVALAVGSGLRRCRRPRSSRRQPLVLAAGLLVAGCAVPLVAGSLGRRAARRQAAARGELTAELVELLQAAPELVVYGQEPSPPRPAAGRRPHPRPDRAPRRARRRCRRRPRARRHRGDRRRRARRRRVGARRRASRPRADRDAGAARARVVRGGPAAVRGRPRARRDARGRAARPRADRPRAACHRSRRARPRCRAGRSAVCLEDVRVRYRQDGDARARAAPRCASSPAAASRSSARAAPARRPSPTCSFASSTRSAAG